jgi:hypothetical protein
MWQERKMMGKERKKGSSRTYRDSVFNTLGIIRKISTKLFQLHIKRTPKEVVIKPK